MMRKWPLPVVVGLISLVIAGNGTAQSERDKKVLGDRDAFAGSDHWIYNDVTAAVKKGQELKRPVLVVFRCIPCENCHEFDEQVAGRDPVVGALMEKYVCVRVIQANHLDLTRFQFDFDQSFAAMILHEDGTVLGRYGTRSGRLNEAEDVGLLGLKEALEEGLKLHANYKAVRKSLEGKQVREARFIYPEDYPRLLGKYEPTLSYTADVAKSCIHCHMVGEAERAFFRDNRQAMPETVLFSYPHPRSLGLEMDPASASRVRGVVEGSPAARAGFRQDDRILLFAGQPPLSTADLQWVLQHAPAEGEIQASVLRDGKELPITLELEEGWRKRGDLSWRATTWDLRRMAFGGMVLEEITDEDRQALKIEPDSMALRVKHVGQYGEHAVAKNAGVKAGDLLIRYDGLDHHARETDLLAHALEKRMPGERVELVLLREGQRKTVTIALQ